MNLKILTLIFLDIFEMNGFFRMEVYFFKRKIYDRKKFY